MKKQPINRSILSTQTWPHRQTDRHVLLCD